MIVYISSITPRLRYITDFIGKEITGKPFRLTSDAEEYRNATGPKINYSDRETGNDELHLFPHSLLFENDIKPQSTDCFETNGYKAFFKTGGDYPFDIFAASFYLLSRYEEYLPHAKDLYGRYAHENSIAFKEDFLHLPLVNIWMQHFSGALKNRFPSLQLCKKSFRFIPTYDIDEAFCYKYKSRWRTWGGYCRSALKGRWWEIQERKKVLKGDMPDPYDSFEWIRELHYDRHYLDAYFFILVAEKTSRFDKNNSPHRKEIQEMFQEFFSRRPDWIRHGVDKPYFWPGLHPSWQSGDQPELLKREKEILSDKISSEFFFDSRQHFVRFTLPDTFRQLIDIGIDRDHSMGYGSINGFRASVASEFYWYDLPAEKQTNLELFPFCYMDANSCFEQKLTPEQALEEMKTYMKLIKDVNGLMITVWHNTFLGTHRNFTGWREAYRSFIYHIYYKIPYVNEQVDNEGMDKIHFPH